MKDLDEIKLALRRAIFSGNTMIRNMDKVNELLEDGFTQEEIITLADQDEELNRLLSEIDELGERFIQ